EALRDDGARVLRDRGGAARLIVGRDGVRHEQARHARLHDLAARVVARRADEHVERAEVAGERVERQRADVCGQRHVLDRDRRARARDFEAASPELVDQAERGGRRIAEIAGAERKQRMAAVPGKPERGARRVPVEQLVVATQRDRRRPHFATRPPRPYDRERRSELAGLDHEVEVPLVDRHDAVAGAMQAAPRPDAARHVVCIAGVEEALERPGSVENGDGRPYLFEQQTEADEQLALPRVAFGARPRFRDEVVGRKAHIVNHVDGGCEGEEERVGSLSQAARIGEASAQMTEPCTVDAEEDDARSFRGSLGHVRGRTSARRDGRGNDTRSFSATGNVCVFHASYERLHYRLTREPRKDDRREQPRSAARMKLLLLTFYYPPDLSAGSFRAAALAEALLRAGGRDVEVDVLTTRPHRYASYRDAAAERARALERSGALTVTRLPVGFHRSGLLDQS